VAVSATTLRAGKEGEYAKTGHGGRPFDNFGEHLVARIAPVSNAHLHHLLA